MTTSGGVKCWGKNGSGQLGDGTTNQRTTPVNVSGLASGAASLAAGYDVSCALTTGGGVKCWGQNHYGQVGDGTTGYSTLPVNTDFSLVNSYSYNNHAVTSLSSGETYTYDANGNMTARLEGGLVYTQTFDAENRLVSVSVGGQTTQFVYDGDGNLVKKIKPDGSRTIYIGNVYEVDKTSGGAVSRTVTYYPAGGAMRINSTVYYVLKDRLGSGYATTDASGNTVGETRYYATGETRLSTGTMFTDRLFTGQREIAGLGIYHYGARFYSPKLGRFLSADTIIQNLANPQLLNRYSYVNNNPLRYTDPTGHMMTSDDEGGCYICSYAGDDGGTDGGGCTTTGGGGGGSDGDGGSTDGGGGGSEEYTYHLYSETNLYELGWQNFGSAWSTWTNPNASLGQRYFAGAYVGAWGGAHAMFAVGAIILAWEAIVPGSMSCVMNPACEERLASSTEAARALGQAGEAAAGILKNTARIPSLSGTASYRIPDQLIPAQRLISEVKNVSSLSLTNQLSDFVTYAQANKYSFELWTRTTTVLSEPLQLLIDAGTVVQRYLP